jgi:cytochrome aa3-600 menaquinol oxidase subunit 2
MRRGRAGALASLLVFGGLLTGCGPQYAVLDPAGPVAAGELHLIALSSLAMAVVIALVYVLFVVVVVRFRDRPGRRAPYVPHWQDNRRLELLWFLIPAVLLTVIAIPTAQETFALARIPAARHRLVVDVTSFEWKWLFQYPRQHIATVNYAVIPTRRPVLFELTANSPMNAFWVPRLGGTEYTMPGRVLPLWLEADAAGRFWGHSEQFSGVGYERMFFTVRAVPAPQFATWAAGVRRTAHPMTLATFRRLLRPGTVGTATYAGYPADTFPRTSHGFSLRGGMYTVYRRRAPENTHSSQ